MCSSDPVDSLRKFVVDLLSFDAEPLYFDNPPSEEIVQLLQQAAEDYSDGQSEAGLQRAFQLAPENLMVLVSLFRYFFYQHRYPEALDISQKAREVVRQKLGLPQDWSTLSEAQLAEGHENDMVLVRFYLLCLKGEAYLYARQGETEKGIPLLEKVAAMDSNDDLKTTDLLAVFNRNLQQPDTAMSM
ncbi:MAG: hypothetical protein P9E88_04720 [Candidatus Competibacter sp.]|nr:hypothetical protein [Candidatus Competibacter sp.]